MSFTSLCRGTYRIGSILRPHLWSLVFKITRFYKSCLYYCCTSKACNKRWNIQTKMLWAKHVLVLQSFSKHECRLLESRNFDQHRVLNTSNKPDTQKASDKYYTNNKMITYGMNKLSWVLMNYLTWNMLPTCSTCQLNLSVSVSPAPLPPAQPDKNRCLSCPFASRTSRSRAAVLEKGAVNNPHGIFTGYKSLDKHTSSLTVIIHYWKLTQNACYTLLPNSLK